MVEKQEGTGRTLKGKYTVELHQRAVDTSDLSKSEPRVHFLPPQEQETNYINIAFCPKDN